MRKHKNRKRSPFVPWHERILAILGAVFHALARQGRALGRHVRALTRHVRAFSGRLLALVRTLRTGPLPAFDADDGVDRAAPVQANGGRVTEATGESGAGVAASTIVPSSRWDALDGALGKGRERWRNLATAAVAVLALVVAVSVLWSTGGDDDAAGDEWAAAPAAAEAPAEALPSLVVDDPVAAAEELVAAATADEPEEPLPDGVPSHIAYGDPVPAPPSDPPARATEVAGAPSAPAAAAKEPSAPTAPVVAEPEPEPESAAVEIDPDEARALARKAGCPDGTLPTEVLAGDTVRTIAWRHAGDEGRNLVPRILDANRRLRPSAMQPGDLVCVPDVERVIVGYANEVYRIRRGDTISGLAERFGHLSRANVRALTTRARKKDMLFAGREVSLPIPKYATRL